MKNIGVIGMCNTGTSLIASLAKEVDRGITIVGEDKKEEPFDNARVYRLAANAPFEMDRFQLTRKQRRKLERDKNKKK